MISVFLFTQYILLLHVYLYRVMVYQRGATGEMSKYVPFLHSEAGQSLLLYSIGTIFALNRS